MPHFVMEGIKNIMEHVNKKLKKNWHYYVYIYIYGFISFR